MDAPLENVMKSLNIIIRFKQGLNSHQKLYIKCGRVKRSFVIRTIVNIFPSVAFQWRHDTQHNDIQHNDIQHNDIKHNGRVLLILSVTYAECHM